MTWAAVARKFERLSADFVDAALRKSILNAVAQLEAIQIASLTGLLAQVRAIRT
jgi:hypothetical protein